MSNETQLTVITPKTLAEAKELSTTLSASKLLPAALQKSPADVLATVMAGAELGLAPMQSVRAIAIIQGKPTLSADAMGALVRSAASVCEYLVLEHSDATKATYSTKRKNDPKPTSMSFTIEEAKQAGLTGRGSDSNWSKYPAAMLRARALSALCRAVYPDLLLGVYDPDELPADSTPPRANVVDGEVVTPPASPPRGQSFDKTETVARLGAAIDAATTEAQLKALADETRRELREEERTELAAKFTAKKAALRAAAEAIPS